jgi:predicted component of type VI protein secretion system
MKLTLEWRLGGMTHSHTVVGLYSATIGRSAECDISIVHEAISRQHARITFAEGDFQLENLSQSNPIIINETTNLAANDKVKLQQGYLFRVGVVEFVVTAVSLNPLEGLKLKCANCDRAVDASLTDCPWCGTSLAFAETFIAGFE